MKTFHLSYPNLWIVIISAFMSIGMYNSMGVAQDTSALLSSNLYLRASFIGAAFLMGADAFQGSLIAYREISDRNNWYFWIALFYVCQLLAVCGAAMAWDHINSPAELFLVCEIGGMIIGYIVMMMFVESENKLPIQRYDLDRYLTKSVVGSIFYFLWPFVVFILIAGGIIFLPAQDENTVHIFITFVLGVMFMPLYRPANFAALTPRLLGYALLVSGVLWF